MTAAEFVDHAAAIARLTYERHLRPGRRNPVWVYDDGGRRADGYKGNAPGDCFTRALAIATGMNYRMAATVINGAAARERITRRQRSRSNARTGVRKPTTRRVLEDLGWEWHPTMDIGTGCRVHLRADELPRGRILVQVSRHVVAVIDGVIHDTFDPSRQGTRCVYGYWTRKD